MLRLEHGFAGELSQREVALSSGIAEPPSVPGTRAAMSAGSPLSRALLWDHHPCRSIGSFWAQAPNLPGDAGALKRTV